MSDLLEIGKARFYVGEPEPEPHTIYVLTKDGRLLEVSGSATVPEGDILTAVEHAAEYAKRLATYEKAAL